MACENHDRECDHECEPPACGETHKAFCDWLRQYFESLTGESNGLTANQVDTVKRNLAKVKDSQ